jgi:predicted flap endonuclease-1-like 5' DNA nuclease
MTDKERRQLAGLCHLATNNKVSIVSYKGRHLEICLESIKGSGPIITTKLSSNGIVEFLDVNNKPC